MASEIKSNLIMKMALWENNTSVVLGRVVECYIDSESLGAKSITSLCFDSSSRGCMESLVN